jgi:hypothetical protein
VEAVTVVLTDITEQASPAIRMWDENWVVQLNGKTIGLVRRHSEFDIRGERTGKTWWNGEVYCGTWKRPDGWPLRTRIDGDHPTKEAAAAAVEAYHRFGEADGWQPGFGCRYLDHRSRLG